ncbi:MAG: hypothetical protein ACO3PV_05975 [Pseudohongiellaceae bacterium]
MSLRLRITLVIVILFLLALCGITTRSVAGAGQVAGQFIALLPLLQDHAQQ